MKSALILSVRDASVRYGGKIVFENLSFNLHQGSRIALVGRNGAGKTTLMRVITGDKDLDDGERWQEKTATIGYLSQEPETALDQTVFEYVLAQIKPEDRDVGAYRVETVTQALSLDVSAKLSSLSGGQLRRAGLAKALVEAPDVLLLDEPTNHLDLEAIQWLEEYLNGWKGTLLCVSHDRAFLSNITNRVFWLDRGSVRVCPKGFAHFDDWAAELLEQEASELRNRKQVVSQEIEWAQRGVKARQKRNVRRLERAREMSAQFEADQAAYRRAISGIRISEKQADTGASSRVVAEFHQVCKSFSFDGTPRTILDRFNLKIVRGERIGIIGKNGSGKTTFLNLLTGDLEPDMGRVKRKTDLEFSFFRQNRSDLNPADSLRKVLSPTGGDYIRVMGKERHVCGYLKDFLFDPADAHLPVSTLSGGQKNRLMLSKVLADPKSGLILDEPTNDLDMDTLDMLEEILERYPGTLIVVSHDREFLNHTVSRILAFEGDGIVESFVGNCTDYLTQKRRAKEAPSPAKAAAPEQDESPKEKPTKSSGKLSYKLTYELEGLPETIAGLEAKVEELERTLADGDFFSRDPEGFSKAAQDLDRAKADLDAAEIRWLELEEMREQTQ